MAVSSIASEMGIPESTVRGRLNRLVSQGIVQFAAIIDPLNLGYSVWVWIGLQVELSRTRKVGAARRISRNLFRRDRYGRGIRDSPIGHISQHRRARRIPDGSSAEDQRHIEVLDLPIHLVHEAAAEFTSAAY